MKVHHGELSDVSRYIENHKHLTLEDHEAEFASTMWRLRRFAQIDESTRMLEIGVGTGWFPIMCKLKGLTCKGLEISPQLVDYALEFGRRYGVEPDIELGNVESHDIGDSQYDVIIAMSVFEHIEYWREAVKKIYTALKPGGLFYFNSTNRFALTSHEYHLPLYGWLPDRCRYWIRKRYQGDEIMKLGIDFNQFTYRELRKFFEEMGFSTILDVIDILDPDNLRTPAAWKKALIRSLRRSKVAKHLVLTFAPGTTFFCIK